MNTRSKVRRMLVLAAAIVAAPALAATDARFDIPGTGAVVVTLPDGWGGRTSPAGDDNSTSIIIRPDNGAPFEVVILPLGIPPGGAPPTDDQLRAAVQARIDKIAPQAAEAAISMQEFAGASGTGFYYSATDRRPDPGTYKYMTQGILRAGSFVLTFSILTNDGQSEVVEQALALVATARAVGP